MGKTKKSWIVCKRCRKRQSINASNGLTPRTLRYPCRDCINLQQNAQMKNPKKQRQNTNSKMEENIRNIVVHLNEIKVEIKNDAKTKDMGVIEISSDDDDSRSSCDTKQRKVTRSISKSTISIINDTINLDDTAVDEVVNKTLNIADVSTQSADCIVIEDSDSDDLPPKPKKIKRNTTKVAEIGCISHLRRNGEDSVLDICSPMRVSKAQNFSNKPSKKARMTIKKRKRLENRQRKRNQETQQFPKSVDKPQTPKQQNCGVYKTAEEFWGPAVLRPSNNNTQPPQIPISMRPRREIILDGQNVAHGHGNRTKFSVRGIQLVVEHFERLGHKVVVFLPNNCQKFDRDRILSKLEDKGVLIYTPARKVNGEWIQPYDDRYIIDYASRVRGIVVSRDHYRDLIKENQQFQETIQSRLLMYTFVGDHVMFPSDPLGKKGPLLDEFLRLSPQEIQQESQGTSSGNHQMPMANQATSSGNHQMPMANQATYSGNHQMPMANQATSSGNHQMPMASQATSSGFQDISTENQGTSRANQEMSVGNQEILTANQGKSRGNQDMANQGTSTQIQKGRQEVSMEIFQENEQQTSSSQDQREPQVNIIELID